MEAMKIFLVDSNERFRANLRLYIEGYLHHKVVGEASDESGINGCKDLFADIILVNIDKSILLSAHKGINRSEFLGCKKIAMSQRREIIDTHVLIEAGYKGFVSTEYIHRDLENAINAVVFGKLFYPSLVE